MPAPKVACRTPTPGKTGITHISAWRFDCLRHAILAELARGEVAFADLTRRVRMRLDDELLARLGSVGWNVTTVKLELEVRGEIERVPDARPQRLRAVAAGA